jgi:hypothetical protein
MGALRQVTGRILLVRASRHGRRRPPLVRGQPDTCQRDLELPHGRRSGPFHTGPPEPRSSGSGCAGSPTTGRRRHRPQDAGAPLATGGRPVREVVEGGADSQTPPPEASIVPFLKFSRDRRGYEHFYVVEPVLGRRGKTRQRVLYWFRTPPNVKVGRVPFDDDVMRALEAQYPGMRFDWEALRNTPIPSVEPEYWRERRRADRAARRAQDEEDTDAAAGDQPTPDPPVADDPPADVAVLAIADPGPEGVVSTAGAQPGGRNLAGQQRRRRRRRGQRQRGPVAATASGESGQSEPTSGTTLNSSSVPPDPPNDGPEDI